MIIISVAIPVLTPFYFIIKWVMIVEILLVVLLGITGIVIGLYLKQKHERTKAIQTKIRDLLLLAVEQDSSFDISMLGRGAFRINHLLPAMSEVDQILDKEKVGKSWGALQESILEKYLLPYARKHAFSYRWTKRLKAARCFAIMPKVEDETAILHLLKQKIPILKYTAAQAAGKLATPRAMDAILEIMKESTHHLRFHLNKALKRGREKVFHLLEKKLETETNFFTRVSCVEVLMGKMNARIAKLLEPDLHSPHKNLKITAIRALGHFQDPRAIELLIPLLSDPEWEVRAIVARSLGYLHAEEAVKELAQLCRDQTWWVRMNAALALKRMGKRGIAELKAQKAEIDRFAYAIAQYVLALQEEE